MITVSQAIIFFLDFFVPFWILCSYKLLKSYGRLFSPLLVTPSISLFTLWSYNYTGNFHFLVDGTLFLIAYFILTYGLGYSRPDAIVLTSLCTIACDQLWQIPWYFTFYWTSDLWHVENGLIAAPFALMAIPLIPYFLIRMGKGPSLNGPSKLLLLENMGLLIAASIVYHFQPLGYSQFYYLLYLTWFAFFVALFKSSSLKYPVGGPR